jgi:hypothetical protein
MKVALYWTAALVLVAMRWPAAIASSRSTSHSSAMYSELTLIACL